MNQNQTQIVRSQIDDRLVFVHVTNLPAEEPRLSKKVKVGSYLSFFLMNYLAVFL